MSERLPPEGSSLLAKTLAWVFAWCATLGLADVQLVVSILSGVAVGLLAGLNAWVVYRDKIRNRRPE